MMSSETFGPLGSDKYKDYVNDIHGSGTRLLSIINGILDMSKIESGQFVLREDDMSLNETARGAFRSAQSVPENQDKTLTLEMELPDTTIGLHADPRVTRQVILNLLSNAIKFTPDGGRVALAISRRSDGAAIIEVRDSGIGMSPEDITTALQPFVQVHGALARKYQGAGLGLSLARKFMELHGGGIEIESTPGAGTTVRATYPAGRVLAPRQKGRGAA